ncbi:MAG: patatin-like phospholipase family protein [Comamonas sp.]
MPAPPPGPDPAPTGPAGPCALVLLGGGARTAYQVGVLREIARRLRQERRPPTAPRPGLPFDILLGTSAGAINAAFLASRAHQGLHAIALLAHFWRRVHAEQVYGLRTPGWLRASRIATAYLLVTRARRQGSFLDNAPLARLLAQRIDFARIDRNLRHGVLQALGVTASNYDSGEHWTFFHDTPRAPAPGAASWWRPGRRIVAQPITTAHLLASSALPFLMPAVALDCGEANGGGVNYFGDGSMRQIAPLSAALYQGASRILVIGMGQPQRAALGGGPPAATATAPGRPSLGAIAGHAMGSVFQDTLQADVEQAQRINRALRQLPPAWAAQWPYRPVEIVSMQPSQSLDTLAQRHVHALPAATRDTLEGLGALHGSGAALASYLLFEPGFVGALMALGAADAGARWPELRQLLVPTGGT